MLFYRLSIVISRLTFAAFACLLSATTLAQNEPPPLAERYNETQLSLSFAVRSLVDFDYSSPPNDISQLEQQMVDICGDYNSAVWNALTPETADELLRQVDFIAHEEVGASGSGLTDTAQNQMAGVIGRMQTLRGQGGGLATINLIEGGAAGDEFSRLSYFVNGNYGSGSKDKTTREQGFDFDSIGVTGGVDYRFSDQLVGGVALSLGESDTDLDNNLGKSETESWALTFYGSYYIDDWFIDGLLGYSTQDYDNQRNVLISGLGTGQSDQFIKSSTDGNAINISVGGGLSSELYGWQATYTARLDYMDATIDGYTEDRSNSLALKIADQDVESLQLIAGAQFSRALSRDWGTMNPYFGLEVRQEFEDETRVVSAQYSYDRFNNTFAFTSDDADSNYLLFSLGSSFVLSHGRQLFVNYDRVIALEDVTSGSITAGIRFEI